ncbi:immunoglobulin mu heavy chain-like [Xyrauchen texanus]|uniref:immunoglobulin mu heavy chain-like n=1 Tax=Xyrauchen texanus TaxID=154827 RepID=UPI0022428303|nr:immunoglobulin mu heavy chain-like [Xyrauchen texanus]
MNLSSFTLLVLVSYVHGQSLTSSGPEVKKPGESVTLSCVVSGLSLSWLHWIRQKPGRGLEWIGRIESGTGTIFAQPLQGQFSITKDTGKNMVYLEVKSLKTEDTAVYYCAKDRGRNYAFDYWGKGTQVTVTSMDQKPPVMFAMSQCGSTSGSRIFGCLATGFSPAESLSFKWTDQSGSALTDFIQYPSVNTDDKTLKISHITITNDTWNQIVCEAEHLSQKFKQVFKIMNPQTPTLSLVPVTTQKSTFVICFIEDFYPKNLTVTWKVNNTISQNQPNLEYKNNEDTGLYTAQSLYKVGSEIWNTETSYNCEATHQGIPRSQTKNFKATFALTLKPPMDREIFLPDEKSKSKVILKAVVSGVEQNAVRDASVSCKVENKPVTDVKSGDVQTSNDSSQYIRIHNVTVDREEWFNGKTVICATQHTNGKEIKEEIHFDKGDKTKPDVYIYRPDDDTLTFVSLVCEVTSSQLGDVYIMWTVGDGNYIEATTSAPIRQNKRTSVLSILTVTKEEYQKHAISCAVKHASNNNERLPLLKPTRKSEPPEPEMGFALHCNEGVLEEDEFRSLWSTATSFIFLFLFSLTYSAVLSFFKCHQTFRRDGAFDYWGKGTMVTVASAQPSAPQSLLGMSTCAPESDGFLTVGCMARGFSPADSLTFEWTDPNKDLLNEFVQYPAISQNGVNIQISHMRLKNSDWEAKKGYTCTAKNSAGKLVASVDKPAPPPDQRASVYLTAPTKMELDNGTATFICLAKQFSPKTHSFKWFQDGKEVKNVVTDKCLDEKKGSITEYSAASIFQINATDWVNTNTKITCVFEHKAGDETKEAEYTVTDAEDPGVTIDIIPPSIEDMLKNKAGNLKCKVTGDVAGFTKMEIKVRESKNSITEHEQIGNKKNLELEVRIGYAEWSNGTEFVCVVEHSLLAMPKEKVYVRENGGEHKRPTIYILAPPEHREGETMTLTCYVKDFYPKEVFVSWLANDEPVNSGDGYKQNTTTPMQINNYFSIYSQLTFASSNWKEGTVYSCVVYHESIDQSLQVLSRSIDSNTDKSSIINVSLNTPPCKA